MAFERPVVVIVPLYSSIVQIPDREFYNTYHRTYRERLTRGSNLFASTKSDREIKIPLYAEGGIPEVWLLNISEQCLEVYRTPSAEGYQEIQKLQRGQKISLQEFPDIEITVDEILGLQK